MVVVGRPQSVQTTSVIGVLDPRSLDFFDHLIDDGDEIRKRFVAHGRIRPMWSKPQESAIEPAVDRPAITRQRATIWGVERPWRRPRIYQDP
jgi:hypothetical protein